MFKSPNFWKKKSFLSYILLPVAWLYLRISRLKMRSVHSYKLSKPVICVGNLVMGGAGKTPTVIALVAMLKKMGHTPHILSRGYGAIVKGIKKVDPERHHYLEVGDEPLMLSQFAPTWVCPNRIQAGKEAIKNGATVLIMDDGFQNKALEKDLNLLVVDSIQGFGNQEVFPAGPLREPVKSGLNRADAVFFIGGGKSIEKKATSLGVENAFKASFINLTEPVQKGERVLAFSGIGYPEKFQLTLKRAGYKLVEFAAFADHYPYTIIDMERLLKAAEIKKAQLMTTSKDFIRIPTPYKENVKVFKINLQFEAPDQVEELLERVVPFRE